MLNPVSTFEFIYVFCKLISSKHIEFYRIIKSN